ncbi:unnamed protein product [Zymoseptoria tritici ST99CH_3D1]|nr:unnamed protein product [Zymoseptoria tritici ST99CH_3D1]
MSRNTRASAQDSKHDLSVVEFKEKCRDGLVLDSAAIFRRPQQTNGTAAPESISGTKRSGAAMNDTTSTKKRKISTEEPARKSWAEVEQEVAERNMANPKVELEVIPGEACRTVLSIKEMAEHICANLDTMSILRARQVNRVLRQTIAGSSPLGSIIFLSAMDSPPKGTPAVRVGGGNAGTQQLDPDDEAPEPPNYVLYNPFVFDPPNAHYPVGILTVSDKFANWVTNTSDGPFPLLDDMFLINPPIEDLAIYLAENTYDGEIPGECLFEEDGQHSEREAGDFQHCGHITTRTIWQRSGLRVRHLVGFSRRHLVTLRDDEETWYSAKNCLVVLPEDHEVLQGDVFQEAEAEDERE